MPSLDPDRRKQLEKKLLEHLEAALATTDELNLGTAGYLVERALDEVRSVSWPHTDPNIELFRKRPRRAQTVDDTKLYFLGQMARAFG